MGIFEWFTPRVEIPEAYRTVESENDIGYLAQEYPEIQKVLITYQEQLSDVMHDEVYAPPLEDRVSEDVHQLPEAKGVTKLFKKTRSELRSRFGLEIPDYYPGHPLNTWRPENEYYDGVAAHQAYLEEQREAA